MVRVQGRFLQRRIACVITLDDEEHMANVKSRSSSNEPNTIYMEITKLYKTELYAGGLKSIFSLNGAHEMKAMIEITIR